MNFIFKNFVHLIKGFKTSFVLNVLGLTAAFTVIIIIAIQTYSDATYNHNLKEVDNIEKVSVYYPSDGRTWLSTNIPLGEKIVTGIPEVKNVCSYGGFGLAPFDTGNDNLSKTIDINYIVASRGFFEVFTPEIIAGDTSKVLNEPGLALISQKTAENIYGTESPIGKTLYDHRDKNKTYTIVAVYKDFPKNCILDNGIITYIEYRDEEEWSYVMYLLLQEGSRNTVFQKLNTEAVWGEEFKKMEEDPQEKKEIKIAPLKDFFMDTPGNKTSFYSLIVIALAVLFIACTNYVNFSVAMIPSRVRSINIHKIFGINKRFLKFSLQMEGVFLALIASALAIIGVYAFASLPLSSYFSADLSISDNLPLILIVIVILLIIIYFISIYTVHNLTSFKEAVALKASYVLSPKGIKLRNILITIQFSVAIFLICFSVFIKVQYNYMRDYDSGIQKENIVFLPANGLKTDYKTFGDEILRNPAVLDYTTSRSLPGSVTMSWGLTFEGKNVGLAVWSVAPNFLDFFGARIIAGENFSESVSDSTNQIIMNERFCEKYDFSYGDLIGKQFPAFSMDIKGVAANINFESVKHAISPMAFAVMSTHNNVNYVFLKLSGKDTPATISYIEQTWKKFSDDDFKLTFLDDEMDKLYVKENNTAKLLGLFGAVTIVIAIMGIYGLIVFNTRYKRKEIAIRKVNGSTENEIILILNKSLLLLLLLAFVVAIPLAYYSIGQWLNNYAYKAPIPWWLFPSAGLAIFIISAGTVSWQSWRAATANPVDALKNE